MYSNTAAFKNKPKDAPAPPPATQGLLDQVGVDAISAIAFKRLRSAYAGNCCQVRRSSDSTTQDIGFTAGGEVDTAAIASFVGTGNTGTISIWYDQSGNGNDFATANTPNAGTTIYEPFIYYNNQVTTDAGGNVAAYSIDPGSTSATGTRFMNSPSPMSARQSPTITMFGQINWPNGIGIMQTEQNNGYNIGTYGSGGDNLKIIRSNGSNLVTKTTVSSNATDSWASTIFYYDDGGAGNSKWWLTSQLNGAPFENSFQTFGMNAPTFDDVSIFRYNLATSLYQNCAISGWIYWDLPDATTLSSQEVYDLYDWVETNLGYTNNAPTP